MRKAAAILVVLIAAGTLPVAGTASCAAAQYHQFDFWLGHWNVTGKQDKPVGIDTVVSEVGGCALIETWKGKGGGSGVSLNYYDPADRMWHQEWVGTSARLHLKGGLEGNRMVLVGGSRSTPKGTIEDRITWEPRADGSVLQVWWVSSDQGKSWKVLFSGTYRKAE